MSSKKGMYLEQIVIKNENGLPSLLREVADYIEQNNLDLWDCFIDTQPEDESSDLFARLILSGFVKLPNKVLHADAATPPSAEPDSGSDIVPAV